MNLWLPGCLTFPDFFPLERLRVSGICEGILYGSLPLPVTVVGSPKRRLWVKGPVGSLKNHCFYFIDAEAEDQRGRSACFQGSGMPGEGLHHCTMPSVICPLMCVAGAWERLGRNVVLDGWEFGELGGASSLQMAKGHASFSDQSVHAQQDTLTAGFSFPGSEDGVGGGGAGDSPLTGQLFLVL